MANIGHPGAKERVMGELAFRQYPGWHTKVTTYGAVLLGIYGIPVGVVENPTGRERTLLENQHGAEDFSDVHWTHRDEEDFRREIVAVANGIPGVHSVWFNVVRWSEGSGHNVPVNMVVVTEAPEKRREWLGWVKRVLGF
jgi:hypothetical protein